MLNALSIALEVGLLIGLIGLAPGVLRSAGESNGRAVWVLLLVVGVISGIGIFAVRISGAPPRAWTAVTSGESLPKEIHELIKTIDREGERLNSTRWMKLWSTADPAQTRLLTRQDFQEARKAFGVMREKVEQVLKLFAEAESKKVDLSTASTTPALTRAETWRVVLEGLKASSEMVGLIDEHWEEWIADPSAAGDDVKPWRLEVARLGGVAAETSAQLHALITPGLKPMSPETVALRKKLRNLVDTWSSRVVKFRNLRWVKADSAQHRKLPQQDLLEAHQASGEILEYIDQIQKIFAEAESKKIDVAGALALETFKRPDFWTANRTMYSAVAEMFGVVEKNWDDYVAHPIPEKKSDLKPWQREVERLNEIAKAATKGWESPAIAAGPQSAIPTPSVASTPGTAPPRPSSNMDELILKTHLLPAVADYSQARDRLQQTRWVKSSDANSYHPQKITSADLHDAGEKLRTFIPTVDKIIADLKASTVAVPAAEHEFWRVKREASILFQELTKLLEVHWKEWHITGIEPRNGAAKDWQKEAVRLQAAIDKLNEDKGTSILL
jgi:hypothetical protein